MSNRNHLNNPSKLVASSLAIVALGTGVSACGGDSLNVGPGSIVCSGSQEVTVAPGHTLGQIVEENVDSRGTIDTPQEFQTTVDGITFQIKEIQAGRAEIGDTFTINGTYDVPEIRPAAGDTIILPEYCVVAGEEQEQ